MHEHNNTLVAKRLAIIAGHLKRVQEMVNNDRYCIDILNQSLAVQKALRQVDMMLLDHHLHTCVQDALKGSGEKREAAIKELIEVYKRTNR
jgi:DNA-binding FrmR family transcriptional regulator